MRFETKAVWRAVSRIPKNQAGGCPVNNPLSLYLYSTFDFVFLVWVLVLLGRKIHTSDRDIYCQHVCDLVIIFSVLTLEAVIRVIRLAS